jgi:phage terminase small subunit
VRGGSRSGAGRKRKDPELKRLAGTLRADRDPAPPAIPAGPAPMIAPMHLSDLAQLNFRGIADLLAEQGRAAPEYAQHVALLAQRLEQIQRWQAVLESVGDTYTAKTVKKVGEETIITVRVYARPEVAMLADAMRQAQSLIGELMLNPSAALRIASGHKPEAGAFDDF